MYTSIISVYADGSETLPLYQDNTPDMWYLIMYIMLGDLGDLLVQYQCIESNDKGGELVPLAIVSNIDPM